MIKALPFSESASSERSSSDVPCFYAPKVRSDLHSDSTAVTPRPTESPDLFTWIAQRFGGVCALVWICKGDLISLTFKFVFALSSFAELLNVFAESRGLTKGF